MIIEKFLPINHSEDIRILGSWIDDNVARDAYEKLTEWLKGLDESNQFIKIFEDIEPEDIFIGLDCNQIGIEYNTAGFGINELYEELTGLHADDVKIIDPYFPMVTKLTETEEWKKSKTTKENSGN